MSTDNAIPSLMFFTIGVVLIAVIALAVAHVRKRRNRHPMDGLRERNLEEMQRGKPPERE